MAPHHLPNATPYSDNSQAGPKFSWPDLHKHIGFYESGHLCYLPAIWGRLAHSLFTDGGSYG